MDRISEFFASIGFKVDSKGLDKFNSDLDVLQKRIIAARQQAMKLNSELRSTAQARVGLKNLGGGKGGQSAAKSVANLNSSAQSGAAKIQHYTAKVNRLANAMERLSRASGGVRLPSGNISIRQGGVPSTVTSRRPVGGGNINMFGGGNAFVRNMLPFAGASLGAAVIMKTIRTGEKMLGSRIAINAVSGNPQAGSQNWEFINQLADRLGTPLVESADQFAKISAAAQGTQLEGDPVREIFESVQEFGKARMVEPERLNLSIRAIGQMINKQQIMAEELKSQFGEHLPGAMQLAAKAMGKTVPELFKAVEAGEVMADDFLPKLAKVMKEAAREGGALEKALQMSSAERGRAFNDITRITADLFMVVDNTLGHLWRQMQRIATAISGSRLGQIIEIALLPLTVLATAIGAMVEALGWLGDEFDDTAYVVTLVIGAFGALITTMLTLKAVTLGLAGAKALGGVVGKLTGLGVGTTVAKTAGGVAAGAAVKSTGASILSMGVGGLLGRGLISGVRGIVGIFTGLAKVVKLLNPVSFIITGLIAGLTALYKYSSDDGTFDDKSGFLLNNRRNRNAEMILGNLNNPEALGMTLKNSERIMQQTNNINNVINGNMDEETGEKVVNGTIEGLNLIPTGK